MTDYEYYAGQRLHKQDEVSLEVTALPLVNSDLLCSGFPLGSASSHQASVGEGQSLWSRVGSSLAGLLLPEPLGAHARQLRRPPRGLGGLVGSFSWFFGAVPEEPDYESLPVGPGPAVAWRIDGVWPGVHLCNTESGLGCHPEAMTQVELRAVAEGSLSEETPPWGRVYFFHQPTDGSALPTLVGQAEYTGFSDAWGQRFHNWRALLEGAGITAGPVAVYAVGVRPPDVGGAVFATELANFITAVSPPSDPITVDGILSPGEWDDALVIPFDTTRVSGGTVSGRVLITNSPEHLYFAAEVDHDLPGPAGTLFDIDLGISPWGQCEWDHVHARVRGGTDLSPWDLWTLTTPPKQGRCDPLMTDFDDQYHGEGTNDVQAAFSTGGGTTVIETVRLLDTGDAFDILLERGAEYEWSQAWVSRRFPDMTYDYFKNVGIFNLIIR
jgi:hypothetical protein